jgi:hypothetical protein
MENNLINYCYKLIDAYRTGKLGQTKMPEDSSPMFSSEQREERLSYFTLPMVLNYQRDSISFGKAHLKHGKILRPEKYLMYVFQVSSRTMS